MSLSDHWTELVAAALLGTDRRAVPERRVAAGRSCQFQTNETRASGLRPAIQMKGIARDVQTYAIKGRKRTGDAPAFALNHPAGVAIDLDPTALDDNERNALADKLAAMSLRLREKN